MGFPSCSNETPASRGAGTERRGRGVLAGKKAIVFGERDDVAGPTIRSCVEAAGAEVVYETTSCFV